MHELVSLQLMVITENNPGAGLFSRVNPEVCIVFIFTLCAQQNTEGTCNTAHRTVQSYPRDEPPGVARWHCRTEIPPVAPRWAENLLQGGQRGALG